MALVHGSLVITDTAIVFCQPIDGQTLEIDMSKVAKAEARIQEIQCLTAAKAPELLSFFNEVWADLDKLVNALVYQCNVAKDNSKKVRSRILLDEVPAIIKAKDLPSSKDIRDAIIDGHDDMQKADEMLHQVTCILELVKGKQKAIEMAYSSVKKCIGDQTYNYSQNRRNPNVNGISETAPTGTQSRSCFGTPKY